MLETPTYEFSKQWTKGDYFAGVLDAHYGKTYDIERTNAIRDLSGIDRILTDKNTGMRYSVEYKTDTVAARTGNIFVETMSVDKDNKRGWSYTMCAQLLYYFIPELKTVYKIQGLTLKHFVPIWAKTYKDVAVKNVGYFTHGLLVPIDEFARCCYGKDTVE